MARFPIIYIEYYDHSWLDGHKKSEILKSKAPLIKEVGFLIGKDKQSIKFCKTITKFREVKDKSVSLDEATVILRGDIKKLIKLKKDERIS